MRLCYSTAESGRRGPVREVVKQPLSRKRHKYITSSTKCRLHHRRTRRRHRDGDHVIDDSTPGRGVLFPPPPPFFFDGRTPESHIGRPAADVVVFTSQEDDLCR